MGTSFYCYRIAKCDFWQFAREVSAFYKNNHMATEITRSWLATLDKKETFTMDECWEVENQVRRILKKLNARGQQSVDLQLFDLAGFGDAEHYLFRVLESGYQFMNERVKQGWPIEERFYDDHSDMQPEMDALRPLVDWTDEKIRAGEYLIYPIMSLDDQLQLAWKLVLDFIQTRKHKIVERDPEADRIVTNPITEDMRGHLETADEIRLDITPRGAKLTGWKQNAAKKCYDLTVEIPFAAWDARGEVHQIFARDREAKELRRFIGSIRPDDVLVVTVSATTHNDLDIDGYWELVLVTLLHQDKTEEAFVTGSNYYDGESSIIYYPEYRPLPEIG